MLANLVVWTIFGILGGKLHDIICNLINANEHRYRRIVIWLIVGIVGYIISVFVTLKPISYVAFVLGVIAQTVISAIRNK